MGKVIKNVVKTVVATLCGLLVVALVVPLAVSLLVSVPAVQNVVVNSLATRFSERLGTKVSVDRVGIRLINHVEVSGFYVEDYGGDTLLYVPRLAAPVVEPGLWGGPLTLGRVRLTGARLWLRRADGEESMNISRVVDSIRRGRPSRPDSRFRMRVESIEADSLTFGLFRPDRKRRHEGGVDFSRFVIRDAHARIEDFAIIGDTVRMNVVSLGGVERTGLRIDDLAASPLVVSRGAVTLAGVDIRSRGSELHLPSIRLESGERKWSDFGEFSDKISMRITMIPSRVTTDLVGAFAPSFADWGMTFDEVALDTYNVLSRLSGTLYGARTLGTSFSLDFTSSGLPRLEEARFDARLTDFASSGDDVVSIVRSITGKDLSNGLSSVLSRQGPVSLTGDASGSLSDFAATGTISTGAGAGKMAVKVFSGKGGTHVDGRLSTDRFDLGRTLAIKELGTLRGTFGAEGIIGNRVLGADTAADTTATRAKRTFRGTLHGEIGGLEFRDYTYTGLTARGTVDGRRYGLNISAADATLSADATASIDRSGQIPESVFDISLHRVDLAATGLDREDSVSMLTGRLVSIVKGRGLDDANGTVELRDASYTSPEGTVSTPLATLAAQNTAAGKLITLRSEFVDGEFRSRTGYRYIMPYLRNFLQRYVPMSGLGGTDPGLVPPDGADPAAMSNYSIITLDVKDAGRLLDVLAPSAAIAQGSSARFLFNPYTGSFSLSAASEFIEYGGMLAANLEATADNAADSLTVYLSGTDIYSGRGHISRFELQGGAKKRGRIDISLDGKMWRIAADSINFGQGRASVNNLNIFPADNPGQRLTATGVVSSLASDTLHVKLNRFDLSPLGALLLRSRRLEVAGRATGRLDVASGAGVPKIDADMELLDLALNGHEAPPLRFFSRPENDGGVRFRLTGATPDEDLLRGSLSSRGEIAAEVRIDSLDAALMEPFIGDIIENTRGKFSSRLTLGGTLKDLRVDGLIDVPYLETTVRYTRVPYSVANARLAVENSVLILPRTSVGNRLGGTGDMAMRVDMSDFRDIRADIDARTNGMLAFDTGAGDSEAFYGRVFATGSMAIRSNRMGTRMDVSARTDAGTQFHLPLNAKSNVSWADFVVFDDHGELPNADDVLARKRAIYERRLQGGSGGRRDKPLELNLTAAVTPAAEVHILIDPNLGQGISGRGEGVIDMRINPANDLFTMTGDYNISSGRFELSMMDVFNKTFEIASGSTLRWSGAADDALLSVDASYRVRTSLRPLDPGSELLSSRSVPIDCIIRLRDRLSEPEITFDISIPSVEAEARQIAANAMNTEELKSMQFLSLLTTGSFAADNSITGQASNAGVMTTGAVGFDILTNQLNNFLSSEDYDIYFRYRPQDNFSTNQFEMGFSTRFWEDRLRLEIEGNWVDDRAATTLGTNNAANLAGDVSLTWVIDRAGNLRLKVFSQTIDRLNETQGLQENGLGIYYKKDFDAIGDIFHRNNSKFAPDSVIVKTPRGGRGAIAGRKRKPIKNRE